MTLPPDAAPVHRAAVEGEPLRADNAERRVRPFAGRKGRPLPQNAELQAGVVAERIALLHPTVHPERRTPGLRQLPRLEAHPYRVAPREAFVSDDVAFAVFDPATKLIAERASRYKGERGTEP